MSDTEGFTCEDCGQSFPKNQGLLMHRRHKHPEPKVEDMAEIDQSELKMEAPAVEAPKVKSLKMAPYPFHDGAVNENAAIRMIRMAKPFCPVTTNMDDPGIKTGTKKYTGDANCQERFKKNNQGVWDVEKCESLGHDPFYTTFRRVEEVNVVDDSGMVTGKRQTEIHERRLNVTQVSDNSRHSNGMDIQLELARGSRFLEAFGIESPCEFRNCVKPKQVKTRYGEYCSERHARLVAADKRGILLPIGGDPYTEDQTLREREDILENLNIGLHG